MSVFKSAAIFAAACLAVAPMASAATATFQDGTPAPFGGGTYDGTQDATIYWGSDSAFNTGSSPVVYASGANGHFLMKFDVSSLAGQGTVQSAKLILMPENTSAAASTFTFSVYQLADANAGWQQGSKAYDQALTGEVTWDWKVYNTVEWAGAGPYDPNGPYDPTHGNRGASVADTDYLTPALDTGTYNQSPNHTPVNGEQVELTLSAALINHWLAGTNAGLIIIANGANNQGAQFVSSDSPYEPIGFRPALQVTYAPVPEPGTGMLLLGSGGLMLIRRRKGC